MRNVAISALSGTILIVVACGLPPRSSDIGLEDQPPSRNGSAIPDLGEAALLHTLFLENVGQVASPQVRYVLPLHRGAAFVDQSGGLTYRLGSGDGRGLAVREQFADPFEGTIEPHSPSIAPLRFFLGDRPGPGKSGVPACGRLILSGIAPGASVELVPRQGSLEKVFALAPGADPSALRVTLQGATALGLGPGGELEVRSGAEGITFAAPRAFQEGVRGREVVEVRYTIHDGERYGFDVGDYDSGRRLVIDPLLGGTYLGGAGSDAAYAVAVDGVGLVYVAGETNSFDFPTTLGAYEGGYRGGFSDVFVSKFDSGLSRLLASTLIGGGDMESAAAIALDGEGNVFVAGKTRSSGFPTTPGAFDESFNDLGYGDVFVSKFDAGLTRLLGSTFMGSSSYDEATALAVDGEGAIFVAGEAWSSDFPTAPGAFDESWNGGSYDAFLSRLSPDLTRLLGSTYLGGGKDETPQGMAADGGGGLYLMGRTFSADFPVTAGAYDETFNGDDLWLNDDVFVARFDSALTTLLAGTFLGGSDGEWGSAIALAAGGGLYLTGRTSSADFPVTPGSWEGEHRGDADVFVSMLDADLSVLEASTLLGGGDFEHAWAMVLGAEGEVYVSGPTRSHDFPTTVGAFDGSYNNECCCSDAFVARFDAGLSALEASTLLGGGGCEWIYAMALTPEGGVLLAGESDSFDLPVHPGAYDVSPLYDDAFVVILDGDLSSGDAFALLRPAPGAVIGWAPPTFEWAPGPYRRFFFAGLLPYGSTAYLPVLFPLEETSFAITEEWWEFVSAGRPCLWAVAGRDPDSGAGEWSPLRWFLKDR